MPKLRFISLAGFLCVALHPFAWSDVASAESCRQKVEHTQPQPSPDPEPDSSTLKQLYNVGVDLRLMAAVFEDCRRNNCSSYLELFFLFRWGIAIDEIPKPWTNSDRGGETAKFLSIAAQLWDAIRPPVPREAIVYETGTRTWFLATAREAAEIERSVDANRQRILSYLPDEPSAATDDDISTMTYRAVRTITTSTIDAPQIDLRIDLPSPSLPMPGRTRVRALSELSTASGTSTPTNDPLLESQWALRHTKFVDTWKCRVTGHWNTKVALIDSGIDPQQADLLPPRFARRYCHEFDDPGCDPDDTGDDNGHGTALAGILGATTNNRLRVSGTNWNLDLMNLKILSMRSDGSTSGTLLDAVRAIHDASDEGAAVAVVAWGLSAYPRALWEAILYARSKDVLVVAGAGNDQLDLDKPGQHFFPASFRHPDYCPPNTSCPCLDNLIAVGATTLKEQKGTPVDTKASFSNHGNSVVDLGAPGVGITTLGLEHRAGGIVDASGTSTATALVAGAAALVADKLGYPAPVDRFVRLRTRLEDGADVIDDLCQCFKGGRLLNVHNAVAEQTGTVSCPGVPDGTDPCWEP